MKGAVGASRTAQQDAPAKAEASRPPDARTAVVAGPGRPPDARAVAPRPGADQHGNAQDTSRSARRRAILGLVAARVVASQEELAGLLRARGFTVTQATVSRDIADLGLVKAPRGGRHAYVTPRTLAGGTDPGVEGSGPGDAGGAAHPGESRLRRILADYPVTVGRSGLILVLVSTPGSASAIGQALDESPLDDEVGTLAGDNTLLVLFADEPALERWRTRFLEIAKQAVDGLTAADLTSAYP